MVTTVWEQVFEATKANRLPYDMLVAGVEPKINIVDILKSQDDMDLGAIKEEGMRLCALRVLPASHSIGMMPAWRCHHRCFMAGVISILEPG